MCVTEIDRECMHPSVSPHPFCVCFSCFPLFVCVCVCVCVCVILVVLWKVCEYIYIYKCRERWRQITLYNFQTVVTSVRWQKWFMEIGQTIIVTGCLYYYYYYYHTHIHTCMHAHTHARTHTHALSLFGLI